MEPNTQQQGGRFDSHQMRALISILFLGIFIMLLGSVFGPRQEDIDKVPEFDAGATDFNTQARIVNGSKLIGLLQGLDRYEQFAEDLRYFATNQYSEYQKEDTYVVGFRVNEFKISVDENIVRTEGEFGSVGHKIEVELTVLPNERLKTSLIDSKTGAEINDLLPSNSALNQYIASLPDSGNGYAADYNDNDNLIDITLFGRDPEAAERAIATIQELLKDGENASDFIQISYPLSFGEDYRDVRN
jgi:hypothetical protein